MTRYRAQKVFTNGGYFIWADRSGADGHPDWLKYADLPKEHLPSTKHRARGPADLESVEFETMDACRRVARALNKKKGRK